jgi:hypothetical protein
LQSAILLLNINELHQRKKLIYSGDRYTLFLDKKFLITQIDGIFIKTSH